MSNLECSESNVMTAIPSDVNSTYDDGRTPFFAAQSDCHKSLHQKGEESILLILPIAYLYY